MTRSLIRLILTLAALALADAVPSAQAKVFFRWSAITASDEAVQALGGKAAYQAEVKLNGGKADLTVFSFDRGIDEVVSELRKTFSSGAFVFQGGTMANGTVTGEGRVLRLLALRLDSYGQTLLFRIDQTEDEFNRSAHPPAVAEFAPGVPAFPDSESVFFASDDETQMSLLVSRAKASASNVQAYYSGLLRSAGWAAALPTKADGAPAVTVYLKDAGAEILCVFTEESGPGGATGITLLHKRQRTE